MKSKDRKTNCPVCNAIVSADFLKHHIAQMVRRERLSNIQKEKKHLNYQTFKLDLHSRVGEVNGVDADAERDNLEDR
jgi:hypothetical protein